MLRSFSCVLVILWFATTIIIKGQDIYDFTPESRHIDANRLTSSRMSFNPKKQTNFTACYYSCESFSGMYTMNKGHPKDNEADPDRYPEYVAIGVHSESCSMTISRWEKTNPRYYEMTVYDATTSRNYSEKITVNYYSDIDVFVTSDQKILSSSSYFQRVITPENVTLTKCEIIYFNSNRVNTTIELDLNSSKTTFKPDDLKLSGRISSVGNGLCGYKMIDAQMTDPPITLIVTDDNNEQYRKQSAGVIVIDLMENYKNNTQSVFVGDNITLTCGYIITSKDKEPIIEPPQEYCLLYDPRGELVLDRRECAYRIHVVSKKDFGLWKCTIAHEESMDTLEFFTELIEKVNPAVDAYIQDKGTTFNIACQLKNYDSTIIKYCFFTRPDGSNFIIHVGTATVRYSTLTSDFTNGLCGLEITKPLLEEEKGTWKCVLDIGGGTQTGGYISVEKETSIPYKPHSNLIVNLNDSFVIDCQIPYSSEFCYVTSPNGSRYRPDTSSENSVTFGRCSLSMESASPEDNGNWTCHFSQPSGLPNKVVTVELSIPAVNLNYADSEVDEGDDVTLFCNTNPVPIQYCIFVSPQLKSYYLKKSESQTRISYHGKGIEYGDCGIEIKNAKRDDGGRWYCYTSTEISKKNELTGSMYLKINRSLSQLGTANAIGIALGVLGVVALTAGLIILRWRRKRRNLSENTAMEARGSNNSRDEIMQATTVPTSYESTIL